MTAKRAKGFPISPKRDFIFVADYGQPDTTEGGIAIGDNDTDYWRYRANDWRFGEVIAIGPGSWSEDGSRRLPMPRIEIGDVIMFSRKHGTRLPGELRYKHPQYAKGPAEGGLLIRVLDPEKCQAVCDDFKPWWNVHLSQLEPSNTMSG